MALNLTTEKTFRQYVAVEGKNRPPVHQIFSHAQPNGDAISPSGVLVDGVIIPPVFTAVAATDLLTTTGHGLVADVRLRFTTTGTLPAGLSLATDYYVIASGLTANDFKVSATLGGAAVDVTGVGTGTHSWARYLAASEQDQITNFLAHPLQAIITEPQAVLWVAAYNAYQINPQHQAWLIDDYLQRDSQWTWRWADHMDAAATATPPSASDTGDIITPPPTSPAGTSPN